MRLKVAGRPNSPILKTPINYLSLRNHGQFHDRTYRDLLPPPAPPSPLTDKTVMTTLIMRAQLVCIFIDLNNVKRLAEDMQAQKFW